MSLGQQNGSGARASYSSGFHSVVVVVVGGGGGGGGGALCMNTTW